MRALLTLWRDLGREYDAEFETSLKDRVQDALLGSLAIVALAANVAVLAAGVAK